MIGLILVTHGRLADELKAAMEHVVGPQDKVLTVCIGPDDHIEARRNQIHDSIASVDDGDGVIVLTDMFGGTPSNLAMSMMGREGVEVLSGVNLPMLVKLAKTRSAKSLSDCVLSAQAAGRKYITAASHIMPSCRANLCKP